MPDEQKAVWMPLHMEGILANSVDDISANIEAALLRDYIPFNVLLGSQSGAVAIVGSGPSLKKTWKRLRKFKGDIIACNAACQFLLGKGITPTYMFCFDADPLMLEFITPHPDIMYLMGSRCPPKAFDLLEGCQVVCWHAAGDERLEELLVKHGKHEPMVVGGGAAVTRAMIVAMPIGYTEMHIFGGDSSFADGATHIRKSTTEERRMPIWCNHRIFETAPWMAKQVEEFKFLTANYCRAGAKFIVHGDGLLQHVAMLKGFQCDFWPKIRHFCRCFIPNARILWQNL